MACDIDAIRKVLAKEYSGVELEEKLKLYAELTKSKQSDVRVETQEYHKTAKDMGAIDPISAISTNINQKVAEILQSKLYEPVGSMGGAMSADAHKYLSDNFDMYKSFTDTMSDEWSSNKTIQQMRKYTWGVDGLDGLDDINIAYHNQHANMATTNNTFATKTDGLISDAGITSKEELDRLNDVFGSTGLFGMADNGLLTRLVAGEQLDALIQEVEGQGRSRHKVIAEDMSELYIGSEKPEARLIGNNIESYSVSRFKEVGKPEQTEEFNHIEALAALYSLKKIPYSVDTIRSLANGNEAQKKVYMDLVLKSKALKEMDNKVHSDERRIEDGNKSRGNLTSDIAAKQWHLKAFNKSDLRRGLVSSENGWKILREADTGISGIAYRESDSGLKDGGAGLNVSYIKNGVKVPMSKNYNDDNVLRVANGQRNAIGEEGYSLVLTKKEKEELGYYKDVAKTLVHGYAHKELIIESQALRDAFTSKFTRTYTDIDTVNTELPLLIKGNEHPIFIRTDGRYALEDKEVAKLIKDKYELVDKNIISDVGGFKNSVDWVRKDVSQDTTGYKRKPTFTAHSHNIILGNVKKAITQAKTYTIILNPKKIGIDLASGVLLANAKGASFFEMFDYSKEAIKLSRQMTNLRNELLEAKYNRAANNNPRTVEAVKRAEKAISEHEFSPALAGGFFQSLGTDILSDMDTAQGIQVDIENMFKTVLKSRDKNDIKEFNILNDTIKKVANSGPVMLQADAVYAQVSELLGKMEAGKKPADVFKEMSRHIKTIKSNDDMSKYLAEWVGAPGSSLVRLGGAMTVYADLIPRWIMYRHNINDGMTHEESLKDARQALPDYTKNMPEGLQWLSDLYVIPFPSFFTRVPKIIYNAAKRSPMTLLEQMVLVDSSWTVYHSNPLTKLINGSIISNPSDLTWIPHDNMVPDIGF